MEKFDKFCESIVNEIESGKNKCVTIVSASMDAINKLHVDQYLGLGLWYELNEDGSLYISGTPQQVDDFLAGITALGVDFEAQVSGEEEVV